MPRMKKKVTPKVRRFIAWVNRKFPPMAIGYDVAFIIDEDDNALITSESQAHNGNSDDRVIEYFEGWIHPLIQSEADKRGLFLEWENSAAVSVTESV